MRHGVAFPIGVKDDHAIVGIEADYPWVKPKSRDGWRLTFDHLVTHQLGTEVMNCINLQLEPWYDHTIAVIRCEPRQEPTWVGDELYARCTASTEKLSTRHAIAWSGRDGASLPAGLGDCLCSSGRKATTAWRT